MKNFHHNPLAVVILVSHGIAKKKCEVFSFSTWSILINFFGGLLNVLYEN